MIGELGDCIGRIALHGILFMTRVFLVISPT